MPAKRLLLTALLSIVAATAATAPGSASARSVPRGFLGVVADGRALDGSVSFGAQVRRIARSGAETIGLSFYWSQAQPFPNEAAVPAAQRPRFQNVGGVPTDFAVTDGLVATAASAGLRVYPTVIQAPAWAALYPGIEWSPPVAAPYAAYTAALVRRYGPHGTFWTQHRRLKRLPIRVWQIWNEPLGGGRNSVSIFWDDSLPLVLPHYIDDLRASSAAIKAADPGAQVVLAGLVGFSWETMQMLYDMGARPYFDAVALHPYTSDPGNAVRIVRFVRQVMSNNGDHAKPIFVSEVGYPATDVAGVRRFGLRLISRAQADWLKGAFNGFVASRRSLGIAQVLWYRWIGDDTSTTDPFDYAGLLHYAGHGRLVVKPALTAFTKIARRVER
jgi:hypothetical protein